MVGFFLAILGLALWSYFRSQPHMLPDGFSTVQDADTLFPRFIALALPHGVSGLVIAGLLAAAMSSLSSGVNSSSSVITIDFIDRLWRGKHARGESSHLHEAKLVSVFVGASVIVLSIGVGAVGGNLLEVCFRVVNLLVAPLFVLFFMALFVPWATSAGTIAAGLCSVVVAVGIAYGQWFGLSFIWIMPMALVAGIIVGSAASLIPIGSPTRRTD
jgi:Na+/proline symporter